MNSEQYREVMQYLLYLFSQQKKIVNTYLRKELEKKFNLSRYQVYRLIKRLNKLGAIRLNFISKKLCEIELVRPQAIVDLIMCGHARNTETSNTAKEEEPSRKELLRHARQLLKPRWKRVNTNHKKVIDQYMLKPTLSKEEQEEVGAYFELWLTDIQEKILWFRKPDGTDEFIPYTTRFNSKYKATEILTKAENCFKVAQSMHNFGIFLTITLPPIFPQRLALWALTYLIHRIKAKILRTTKQTKPHIRVNEPQGSWNPHTHLVIFGLDFLMNKEELTKYLEKHLNNFLNDLGRNYKKTINRNATDYDILALNLIGSIYVKKYAKYKKQRPKYEGPVNYLTKVEIKDDILVFENPPPDRRNEHGKFSLMKDGGAKSVFDYLRFYMVSNLIEAKHIEEEGVSKNENLSLVWYWFHRMPFFFASPILRTNQEKKTPAGWIFIGAFRLSEDSFIKELAEQSRVEVIFPHAII